jgi:hypothetical protein
VRWLRVDVDWRHVAPTRPVDAENPDDPAYDWARYDTMFTGLAERGIGIFVTLTRTPAWASASGKANAVSSPADGAAFAAAVARRYNGSWSRPGGGTLPAIRSLSPRNEPNIDLMSSPQCRRLSNGRWVPASPAWYAKLLKASYPKLRAANPRLIIVAGETAAGVQRGGCRNASTTIGTLEFVASVHRQLGGGRAMPFDMWAQHLHPVGPPDKAAFFPSWRTMPQLTRLLNRMHPKGRMPIMVSETSYATSYTAFHRYFVTEAQQAAYLTRTYQLAARQPQIEMVVWFNLEDHRYWSAGLYREDKTAKPSFFRFRTLALASPLTGRWSLP